jgi:hypothetical protein
MAIGGRGGFFASVLAWGVIGQQQHPMNVSAEDTLRGGGGGNFLSFGGGTKPGSVEPSPPARTVPAQRVAARTGMTPAGFFRVRLMAVILNQCPLNDK